MPDSQHIYSIRRHDGIAGQFSITARVGYGDEEMRDVTFVGSTYGGPITMLSGHGIQTRVVDPERFGEFGEAWVRRFFAR
jgi:hypothetical protein